jgi:hypothetical protein
VSDTTVEHHPACDRRVCACAAFEIIRLREQLAAARAENERLKKDVPDGWRKDIGSSLGAKVTIRSLDGRKWVRVDRLEELRERAARRAQEESCAYGCGGAIAAAIRALPLEGE